MALSAKVKKSINIVSRLVIALISFWFIYDQVFISGNISAFIDALINEGFKTKFFILITIVILLMPLNWGVEAYKWMYLINLVERIHFTHALKSVFTGITVSLFTPNRVGEFFGRLLTLKNANPLKGALLTITGSMSQLIVTLVMGGLSTIIFLPTYFKPENYWHYIIYALIVAMVLATIILLVVMFLNFFAVSKIATKIVKPGWSKIRSYMRVMRRLKRELLLKVLLLSFFRYIVFSTQFYLLLLAFGLSIPWFSAFVLISMTYFTMAAIPTIALVDLGIRGSVSIYFLSMYFQNQPEAPALILSATTAVWIINLALPALIGMLYINRLNIIRRLS